MSETQNGIAAVRKRLGATLEEFGSAAGLTASGYRLKEMGERSWGLSEANQLALYLSETYGEPYDLHGLFGIERPVEETA